MSDRSVTCWGANSVGQLGNDTTADSATPVPVTGLADVSSLAVGWGHACAVTVDGKLWCWGGNASGQVGDGTVSTRLAPVEIPVPGGTPKPWVTSVTANFSNTCAWVSGTIAASTSPVLYCWGENLSGQLGSPHANHVSPTAVYTGTDPYSDLQVGIGGDSICVLDRSHHDYAGTSPPSYQYCRGRNNVGQFGNSFPLGNYDDFQLVHTFNNDGDWPDYRVLSGGEAFACRANFETDAIACAGAGAAGRLGNGSFANSSALVGVPGSWKASSLSSGWSSSCAYRTSDDAYACWGRNQHGQLGDGTLIDRASPVTVPLDPFGGGPHWSGNEIAAGANHSCALTQAEAFSWDVYCWGSNGFSAIHGTLGTTSVTQSSEPLRVPFG